MTWIPPSMRDGAVSRGHSRRLALLGGMGLIGTGLVSACASSSGDRPTTGSPPAGGGAGAASMPPSPAAMDALRAHVADQERAFAATMARRDLAAFAEFVSLEAVFMNGDEPTTGRAAIVGQWKGFFEGAAAPFAWTPDRVAVLASGRLALTSGPVTLPDGTNPMRFQSTWRLDDDGRWRVVFDSGYRVCRCVEAAPAR